MEHSGDDLSRLSQPDDDDDNDEDDRTASSATRGRQQPPPSKMPGIEAGYFAMLARQADAAADGDAPPPPTAPGDMFPYSGLQHVGFFILFVFPSLALVVVGLRVYSRTTTKQFGWG